MRLRRQGLPGIERCEVLKTVMKTVVASFIQPSRNRDGYCLQRKDARGNSLYHAWIPEECRLPCRSVDRASAGTWPRIMRPPTARAEFQVGAEVRSPLTTLAES